MRAAENHSDTIIHQVFFDVPCGGVQGEAFFTSILFATAGSGKWLVLHKNCLSPGCWSKRAKFPRAQACDELQGFYVERPLPADQFTQLLLAQATNITHTGKSLMLKSV